MPQNVTELKTYLGVLTYCGKFLPNRATCAAPLYKLLGQQLPWRWQTEQDKVFRESKQLLMFSQLDSFQLQLTSCVCWRAMSLHTGAVLAPTTESQLAMPHAP